MAFTPLQYGVSSAAGDVDRDGFDEICVTPGPGPGPSFPSTFRGFDFDGASVAIILGYYATPFATYYGGRVGSGDLTGDDRGELICGPGRDPSAFATVKVFNWDGVSLTVLPGLAGSFTAFATTGYGVSVAWGRLGL